MGDIGKVRLGIGFVLRVMEWDRVWEVVDDFGWGWVEVVVIKDVIGYVGVMEEDLWIGWKNEG